MTPASPFRLVDQATLSDLHAATLDLLANKGIVFQSPDCLAIFKASGSRVEGQTVFMPESVVEKAIQTAPESFDWEARNPERSIRVGAGQTGLHVCVNNGPINIQDLERGRRPGTLDDLLNLYRLAQKSAICSIVGQIPVEPSDLRHPLRHLEIFRHLVSQTDKPVFGYVGTRPEIAGMFDLLKLSWGAALDDARFFDSHRIAVSLNPLSPLRYDAVPCETLLAYAGARQPVMVLTCAMAGVSAPVDPMGCVILQNAEILAGLVLAQLVNPGTPVIYSPASAVPDMRSAAYMTGSPISNLINMVGIQLARELYRLPTRSMSGLTDAKVTDFQAGVETMQNTLMLAMAGVDMVNECLGILDSIMTVSYEKFILDEEILARTLAVVNGIESFDEGFSKSVIMGTAHGGSFLMHPSTMKHCRRFWTPSLSFSKGYGDWEKEGALDVVRKASARVREILAQCPETVLDEATGRELSRYIETAARSTVNGSASSAMGPAAC